MERIILRVKGANNCRPTWTARRAVAIRPAWLRHTRETGQAITPEVCSTFPEPPDHKAHEGSDRNPSTRGDERLLHECPDEGVGRHRSVGGDPWISARPGSSIPAAIPATGVELDHRLSLQTGVLGSFTPPCTRHPAPTQRCASVHRRETPQAATPTTPGLDGDRDA
jgi:hypothetical protein